MTAPVALETILGAFRGVIPSAFATCADDGTPNVTYLSLVHYVDSDRVALSRQFFQKTRSNLDANPRGQVRVVEPDSFTEYLLDLEYVHTDTHGPIFEAMRASTEAIASQSGMTDVFRLRGVDIHRVLRCSQVPGSGLDRAPGEQRNALTALDELTRRLALCTEYDQATRTALEALDDLFAFRHSILLVRDGDRLLAVADRGYAAPAAGAEVPVGAGTAGVAAQSRQVVSVANLARSRVMATAVAATGSGDERDVPLPSLPGAQSAAAVPLVAEGDVIGVLHLESGDVGTFGPHSERLLRILGAHIASVLRMLDPGGVAEPAAPAEQPQAAGAPAGEVLGVVYYQADDSVFVGGEYVVKGVPGRILWKLLREHAEHGREAFANRELRLDERLGLPAGNDNLEARLLVLRKRLAGGGFGIVLERTGRGRLQLTVPRPLSLSEVPTSGPMRAAHTPADGG